MAVSNIEFRVETKDANAKIRSLQAQVQKLEVAVQKAGGSTKTAGAGFKVFSSGAQAAAVGVRGLGAAISAALGPLTAVVAAAVSLGQAFDILSKQDFGEAKVRSLGVNSDELKSRLKEVSAELSGQASVLDLTSAAYDVASAGFTDAADAASILKAATQGAVGGFSDINTVGDAATSVLNAYGLQADQASRLIDGFIQTQNDGKIVIGEYANNIAKVAPVAAALGVPLEQVNAAVAQITAGGQGAEVTFTALKTALAAIAAGNVDKVFSELGVKIDSTTIASDGLKGTLEKIKSTGAGAGEIIKAFGTEAGPAILALLNDTEKYNTLLEKQVKSQGAASRAAFEASDTIQGQLTRLQTAFQNIFSDQSELGILIKEIFKIAAVSVEVFSVGLSNSLAPLRAIGEIGAGVGKAIGEALGIDGVNAAYDLEQGFQANLKRARDFGNFVIGLGKRIGDVIGSVAKVAVETGKKVANYLGRIFGDIFGRISEAIQGAYKLLPPFIRNFLEQGAGAISRAIGGAATTVADFVQETIDIGAGLTNGGDKSAADTNTDTKTTLRRPTQEKVAAARRLTEEEKRQLKLKREADKLEKQALEAQERKRQSYESQYATLDQQRMLLEGKLNGNEKEVEYAIAMSNLHKQHGVERGNILLQQLKENDVLKNRIETMTELDKKQKEAAENMDRLYSSIGQTITSGIVDSLTAAVEGTKSLAEVASDTLRSLANIMLKFGLQTFLGGLGGEGSFFSKLFGGGKAAGGTVKGGKSYLVGERGPELFTPGRTGSIAPNSSMGGANVIVNVDASGTNAQGDGAGAKQLGAAIGAAVQAELIKQKRPGGLLAN